MMVAAEQPSGLDDGVGYRSACLVEHQAFDRPELCAVVAVDAHVLDAITRIVNAEAAASGAPKPPEITTLDQYRMVTNDPDATKRVADAFRAHFSSDRVRKTAATTASEDFGSFGAEWHSPSVFWFIGGTDPQIYEKAKNEGRIGELPTNHNPRFAPVTHPTLETRVAVMVVAAQAWLAA